MRGRAWGYTGGRKYQYKSRNGFVLAFGQNGPCYRRNTRNWEGNGTCNGGGWRRHNSSPGKTPSSPWIFAVRTTMTDHQQRDTRNQETRLLIEKLGRKAIIYTADLSSKISVGSLVAMILKDGYDIDILLNCAGIQRRHPSHLFSLEDWDEVLQVNLTTVFTLCRDVGAHMLTREPDQSGHRGTAKGGIAQLTKALSNEWAAQGINVNAIAPGYIATDMNTALIQDEERASSILARIPAGRWGNPDDFKGSI
ncbi:hypothetical protein N7541_008766, partial [Penicillium brevicompactum]